MNKKKKNSNFLKILLIIAIISLLSFFPVKQGIHKILFTTFNKTGIVLSNNGRKVKKFFSFAIHISKIKSQNENLISQLSSLEVDKSKINELEHENSLLKKELGYKEQNPESKLLSAKIIGREPTNFLDSIIVDKGEKDGVKANMAVISGGVLVGQVKNALDHQSEVTLITSKNSIILAMLQGSRSKGILKGGISGIVLENITQDVNFEQGEYVVTSGLDGQLKSGILIGKTGGIQSASSDLYKNITVEPIADLSRLELVFIMIE